MAFENTPEITTFTGANENPLSEGGNWTQTTPDRAPLERLSNSATNSVAGDPNYSHYTTPFQEIDGVLEAYGCTTGGQLGAALETWRVALWSVVGAGLTGYLVYFGGSIGKNYVIRRYNGSVFSFVQIAIAAFDGYPNKLGIRINGNDIECWSDHGAGWILECTATDTNYRGGDWYAGLAIEEETLHDLAFTCFGAGVTSARRTQIYRIIHAPA